MNDFQKSPVQKKNPDPYEIRINEIDKDKKGKEPFTDFPGSNKSLAALATLVTVFAKFIKLLSSDNSETGFLFDQKRTIDDIYAFRKLLQILSEDDQSHNPEFGKHLSELWHSLMDDCNSILTISGGFLKEIDKLKYFINEVHQFPPGEDHSLGYYFTEYAGKGWIPFPFMEILQYLHDEYIEKNQKSYLFKWISLLSEILTESNYSPIKEVH